MELSWTTEAPNREGIYLAAFHPKMPIVIIRVLRYGVYFMAEEISAFSNRMNDVIPTRYGLGAYTHFLALDKMPSPFVGTIVEAESEHGTR